MDDTGSLAEAVALDNPRKEGCLAEAALFALKEEALDLQAVEGKIEVDETAERASERAGILAAVRLGPGILG